MLQVMGILGRAQISREGAPFAPLLNGGQLRAGDVIRTGAGSAVDVAFGENPGTVRLTENSVLALDKISMDSTNETSEIELSLRSGELLGLSKEGPPDSRFEIKIPIGIARVLHGRYRVQARGYLALVEGKLLFAHVPPGGQPTAHNLNAPPACYFTPVGGVRPAPSELVREIKKQMKARLNK